MTVLKKFKYKKNILPFLLPGISFFRYFVSSGTTNKFKAFFTGTLCFMISACPKEQKLILLDVKTHFSPAPQFVQRGPS